MNIAKRIVREAIGNTLKPQSPKPLILNEAVNFEKQCIFIAVPKTGTTSVRSQLKQQGAPLIGNPHLNIVQVRDSLYVYFLKQALGQNKSFPSESISSDADLRSKAKEVFYSFFKFSAVRNPWARTVSLYSRREGVKTRDKISFEEFCKNHFYASDTCYHPTLHQNQLDWLCDENGRCIVDYVYRLEDFDQAINEITERTNGRVRLESKNANRNPNSDSRLYRDLYTEETRKLIAKRFERDIDNFKYTF
ncbi:MAG: sulfotransferase family protein [Desulfobacteraceae bacterium]|nr:sulfotransferase family protein [Desulfobacteraceae bacterium]